MLVAVSPSLVAENKVNPSHRECGRKPTVDDKPACVVIQDAKVLFKTMLVVQKLQHIEANCISEKPYAKGNKWSWYLLVFLIELKSAATRFMVI